MKKTMSLFMVLVTLFAFVSCQKDQNHKKSEKCCSSNEEANEESVTQAEDSAIQEVQEEIIISDYSDDDIKLEELRVSAEEALKSLEIEKDLIDLEAISEEVVQ